MRSFQICLGVLFLILGYDVRSQISLLSPGEGRSSIVRKFADDSKPFNASSADKTVSYTRVRRKSAPASRHIFWTGYQFFAGGKNGRLPELKNGITNIELQGSFSYYWFPGKGTFNYFYVMPGVRLGRVRTIFPPSATDPLNVGNRTTLMRSIQVGFNSLSLRPRLTDMFLGVACNFGYDDNTERLASMEFGVSKYAGVDTNGNPVFVTEKTRVGYIDSEFKRGMFASPMADIGYSIQRFQPVLHLRWDSYAGDNKATYFSPGFGFYYTEEDNPTKVLYGLQVYTEDFMNLNEVEQSRFKRTKLAVVVSF